MTVVKGGAETNLVEYFNENDDHYEHYGKNVWLAQTFTLDSAYYCWRFRMKSWAQFVGEVYHYSIRYTVDGNEPTDHDVYHTTLSPMGESRMSPGKWRRFDFSVYSYFPATKWAIVASVPDSDNTVNYHLRACATPPLYPDGKAWRSDDSGETWEELPGITFLFEVWGWEPPPLPPPEPVVSNWAPLDIVIDTPAVDTVEIQITTDIPVHLFMRWTTTEPLKHPSTAYRRGLLIQIGTRYCFVSWHENEQIESGDTYIHTFIKSWPFCQTRWFYFIGTKQAEEQPSASPIFHFHNDYSAPPEQEAWLLTGGGSDVFSLFDFKGSWYWIINWGSFYVGYRNRDYRKGGGGYRFLNTPLAPTSIVLEAKLYCSCYMNTPWRTVNSRLRIEDNVSPATFSTWAEWGARSLYSVPILFDDIEPWSVGNWYYSVDISAFLNYIISKPGWNSGQPISIVWDDWDLRSDLNRSRWSEGGLTDPAINGTRLYIKYIP
ncbi:hypothetical protein ES703_40744 [subsurface metagenome]